MPQTVTITCHPVSESGSLEAHLSVNVDLKQPTFAEKVALNNIPLPALNSFIAKYLSVYAKDGYFSFRSEMVSKEGSYDGYMKPFFKDLEFEPMPKDRGGIAALWSGIVNGLKGIVENDETKTVATQVPVHGQYKDPRVSAFGRLRLACCRMRGSMRWLRSSTRLRLPRVASRRNSRSWISRSLNALKLRSDKNGREALCAQSQYS